jgi:hypothetical protein
MSALNPKSTLRPSYSTGTGFCLSAWNPSFRISCVRKYSYTDSSKPGPTSE